MPMFFPDATRGFVRTLSNQDVRATGTQGILVNSFHLFRLVGYEKTIKAGGIRPYIGWKGPIISDSGGFQVMSIAKRKEGWAAVSDLGVQFEIEGERYLFTPEESIKYQMAMQTDLIVVLDDFTPVTADYEEAERTVRRTTLWARRCREVFDSECRRLHISKDKRPYIIGVVQGCYFEDLRKRSARELLEIGFDGYGYGGWPMKDGSFDIGTAKLIAEVLPKDTLLYGLGIGKPDDIVKCYELGWQIFDCVLPTRDARHGRLYVYTADSMDEIDLKKDKFYEFYNPKKLIHTTEEYPVSTACDCELCTTLTRGELARMWRDRDERVLRLATIHNLRFYAVLMEKIGNMVK